MCSKHASNRISSFDFHQRYNVALLTPATCAISCEPTALKPLSLSSLYAVSRISCRACSLRGRPRGLGAILVLGPLITTIPITKIIVSFCFGKHLIRCRNETVGFVFVATYGRMKRSAYKGGKHGKHN